MKSTLKLILRLLSLPKGNGKFFCTEKSKYSCIGARMSKVRGAFPNEPFAGRMNAARLMNGSQIFPIEHAPEYRGFFNGTPGTISSLMARLVPPNLFVSVINGTNGWPPCKRKKTGTVQ